ncbi:MAG: delta-60 repeat domain-containing protein [Bdellovibrionota bacterium]
MNPNWKRPLAVVLALLAMVRCTNGVFQGQTGGGNPGPTGLYRGFPNTPVYAIVVDSGSGDLYIGGAFTSVGGFATAGVARLRSDGFVDTTFVVSGSTNLEVRALETSGTKLLVGGEFTEIGGDSSEPYLTELTTNGVIQSVFGSPDGPVYAIKVDKSNNDFVFIGGDFSNYNATGVGNIIRIKTDVTLDTIYTANANVNNTVLVLTQQAAAPFNLYLGGAFDMQGGASAARHLRLDGTGSADAGYPTGGSAGFDNKVYSLIEFVDGGTTYVLAGGAYEMYGGSTSQRVTYLTDTNTSLNPYPSGFDGDVHVLRQYDVQYFYAGGEFDQYAGSNHFKIARVSTDTFADSGFVTGSGFDSDVFALETAAGRTVYVGGQFTSYNGNSTPNLVRLHSDGSVDTSFLPPE